MGTISQLLLTYLLNACWQIALVTGIAAFCAWLLRGTTSRHQHLLWVIALAFFIGLPVLTSLPLIGGAYSSEPAPKMVQETGGDFEPAPQLIADIQPSQPTPLPTIPTEALPFITINRNWATFIIVLYLLFLCYRSAKLFMAWRRARILKRSARLIDLPGPVRTTVSKCQAALGVNRVRILCSTSITAPIAVGGFKPLIILPERLLLETEQSVLTAAIGHELVHIKRRDYLLNLIYELISLPLLFHPVTALVKRRIRETRELSCDELVTEKLLDAAVYARSLVQLAGFAVNMSRPGASLTVGVADADILEERVMNILRRPKTDTRRKNLLLIAASLIFLVPCVAAAPFALRISIDQQAVAEAPEASFVMPPAAEVTSQQGPGRQTKQEKQAREEQKRKELLEDKELLEERMKRVEMELDARRSLSQELESKIKETHELDRRVKSELERKLMEAHELEEAKAALGAKLMEAHELDREAKAALGAKLMEAHELDGEAKASLEAQLMQEEVRKSQGLKVRKRSLERKVRKGIVELRVEDGKEIVVFNRVKALMARQQAELAKKANIPMQQAVQIAMSQQSGTVTECRLTGERPAGEKDQVFYILTIVSGDGPESATTRMLISAVDGRVVKTWKNER